MPSATTSLPLASLVDAGAIAARASARWRPGLAAAGKAALHSEVFASPNEAAGAGAALALALDDWRNLPRGEGHAGGRGDAHAGTHAESDARPVLWVQTRDAARLSGRPYRAGLPKEVRDRLIHVLADTAQDALFALEEGVRCRDIAWVMGEIAGNPKALDFTASRRLTLASEKYGVPLFLVRLDAARDLSSARMRWDVSSAASDAPRWNAQAPGAPVWRAELFRARGHAPGEWLLHEQSGALKTRHERQADNDTGALNWTAGLQRRRLSQQA